MRIIAQLIGIIGVMLVALAGALVVMRRDGPVSMYLAYSDNNVVKLVRPDGTGMREVGQGISPSWSPDGMVLIVWNWQDQDLYTISNIYDIRGDGSQLHLLTDTDYHEYEARISPDGEWIVFVSNRDSFADIFKMRVDGSGVQNLTPHPSEDNHPRWSPDGEWITFLSHRDGNPEIYIMRADGSDLRNLTQSAGRDEWPEWSPDGEWIAFHSTRNGSYDLYIMRADGRDVRPILTAPTNDQLPRWSMDGNYLVFWSNDERSSALNRVRIADGRIEPLSPRGVMAFDHRLSPDGQWLTYTRYDAASDDYNVIIARPDGTSARVLLAGRSSHMAWSPPLDIASFAPLPHIAFGILLLFVRWLTLAQHINDS